MSRAAFILVITPIYYALLWFAASGGKAQYVQLFLQAQKNMALFFLLWIAMAAVARAIGIEHLKHALSMKFSDAGVELRNRFESHVIRWSSVKHVLPANGGEFVICTTDGAYYFPSDQSWSIAARERLQKAASIAPESYSVIMTADPKRKMKAVLIAIILLSVLVSQLLKPYLKGGPVDFGYLGVILLLALPFAICLGIVFYLRVFRTPEIFAVGDSLLVVDREGEHRFGRDAIKKVWFLGALAWVSTSHGSWAVPTADVVDQSVPYIPFRKSNAKMTKAAIKKAKLMLRELEPKRLR